MFSHKHINLFHRLEGKAAVYKQLNDDIGHDQQRATWCMWGVIICAGLFAYLEEPRYRNGALFVMGMCVVQYIILFIEMSNRNFLMHAIDWMEASARERQQ